MPAGGNKLGQITPVFVEKNLGDQTAPELEQAHGGVAPDSPLVRYVKSVGQRLVPFSIRKDFPHTFKVLNATTIVNAFAIGNGNIYITKALLSKLDDEGELAFILGHEIGHVEKRHIAHKIDQILGTTALLSLAKRIAGGSEKKRDTVEALGPLAKQLLLTGFGRSQELESDDLGLAHSVQAGYDPLSPVRVFKTFQKLAPESKGMQVFLDSHPTATRRIQDVELDIKGQFRGITGFTNRARFQEIVNGTSVARTDQDEPLPILSRPEVIIPVGVAATTAAITIPLALLRVL